MSWTRYLISISIQKHICLMLRTGPMGDRPSAFRWLLCHFVPFLFLLYLFAAFIGLYAFFAPFCLLYVPVCLFLYAPSLGPFPFLSTVYPACPFVPCQLSPSFEHLFRPSFTALTSSGHLFHPFCRTPHLSGPKGPPFRPFRPSFYGFTACLPLDVKAIRAIADGVQ